MHKCINLTISPAEELHSAAQFLYRQKPYSDLIYFGIFLTSMINATGLDSGQWYQKLLVEPFIIIIVVIIIIIIITIIIVVIIIIIIIVVIIIIVNIIIIIMMLCFRSCDIAHPITAFPAKRSCPMRVVFCRSVGLMFTSASSVVIRISQVVFGFLLVF